VRPLDPCARQGRGGDCEPITTRDTAVRLQRFVRVHLFLDVSSACGTGGEIGHGTREMLCAPTCRCLSQTAYLLLRHEVVRGPRPVPALFPGGASI
jgi:hypothetical protein